jgi:hypothetical protein
MANISLKVNGESRVVATDPTTPLLQERESRNLRRPLEDQQAKVSDSPQAKLLSPPKIPPASATSGLIGRVEIARIGLSVIDLTGNFCTSRIERLETVGILL